LGCHPKADDPSPKNVDAIGTIYFHLHNYISDSEVDGYGYVYQNGDGRKISLTKAQFYLSKFQFVKLDGSVYTVPDSIILKVQETETYQIANIPVGNYKAVKFYLGWDSDNNPSSAYPNGVLDHPEMWFGSSATSSGYVYLNLQGKIDTTSDASASASEMQPFDFKLGTVNLYKQVTMPDKNFTISLNQTQYVHVLVDWNILFAGVTLNEPTNLSLTTPLASSSITAKIIANNLPNMFRYED
jgi:hypothetical protein